jgi:hypothetical protein
MKNSHDNEDKHTSSVTSAHKLWAGIFLALTVLSAAGAMYIERVHGSSAQQMGFAIAFVSYLTAAGVLVTPSDLFVRYNEDDDAPGSDHKGGDTHD